MVQCAIKFDGNPHGIVYTNNHINGRVEIFLDKPMSIRGISLIISGKARVSWSESETRGMGKNRRTVHTTYSANEDYIHSVTYLYGSPDGNNITIAPGQYTFNFSCFLPQQLPSSVEGHYGRIRYAAKVVFDRPWKFDKTFTVGLTVLKLTDLNHENPIIRLPTKLQVQKIFWCWPCSSKPLIVEATVPQSGYVCGQHIQVTINLNNYSGRKIDSVNVTLKKIMKCTSSFPTSKTKTEEITIKKMVIGSIQNLPKEEMYVDLLVPAVPPTCTYMICHIIQVYYEIRVKANISGPHISPVISIPITIGNIPLRTLNNFEQSSRSNPAAATNIAASAPSTTPNSPEISAADYGLPPPTYEEALYIERVNMNDEDKHPISESNYIPRYPVFDFRPSAPLSNPETSHQTPEKF